MDTIPWCKMVLGCSAGQVVSAYSTQQRLINNMYYQPFLQYHSARWNTATQTDTWPTLVHLLVETLCRQVHRIHITHRRLLSLLYFLVSMQHNGDFSLSIMCYLTPRTTPQHRNKTRNQNATLQGKLEHDSLKCVSSVLQAISLYLFNTSTTTNHHVLPKPSYNITTKIRRENKRKHSKTKWNMTPLSVLEVLYRQVLSIYSTDRRQLSIIYHLT